ncbi:hypothetical protein CC85DRAFT_330768 [Cutaneotrichosporon oleaginosum]|uniref:Chitin-binding type-1 domain-containing protein n=1 Tax=Cutaneotrichosporon oleaginosum TaxID=879819 RepID=A0A0J0XEA5_9TREE|nr:uncharacterized protein CC85DRAFT_330768 [Cutaneotrichosporon oleaginosum]KLT39396.1 hypothetical protein CC85DRAFT_330768 [Cutaneotrichosporon oleaginosum]TXT07547.1 hypothetical protein COLE_04471 [Cutaneotrichosporon oleaginosum]
MLALAVSVLSLGALANPFPVSEASKFSLSDRSPNVHARQIVVELCAGSPIFERCGGPWCAPQGWFCCGLGACPNGASCLDQRWCCFEGLTEQQCRAGIEQASSMVQDPSAVASMLTRSDILSVLTASFTGMPSGFPTGAATGSQNGAAPTQMAITQGVDSGSGAGSNSSIPGGSGGSGGGGGGGGSSSSGLSITEGRTRRTIYLETEVEFTREWSVQSWCMARIQALRTNETGATISFEIAADVAGFTLSHDIFVGGTLSISQSLSGGAAGIAIGNISTSARPIPMGPPSNTTCAVTYVFTRETSYTMFGERITLIYESSNAGSTAPGAPALPTTPNMPEAPTAQGSSCRINGITLYKDQNELAAVKVGDAFQIDLDPSMAGTNTSASGTSGTGVSGLPNAATTLTVRSTLCAFFAVALLLAY